jgi:hypothetical protein
METLFNYLKTLCLLLFVAACNPLGTENFIGNNFRPGFISQGVSLKTIPALLRGNQSITFQFTIDSEVKDSKLLISYDGGEVFSQLVTLSPADTSYAWTTPTDRDGDEIVFKLEGLNSKEEKVESVSRVVRIDSVAPLAPIVNLESSALTNSLSVRLRLDSCDDRAFIYLSESNAPPVRDHKDWKRCESIVSLIQSNTQGIKSIYVFAKDDVGNISNSGSISITLDTEAPLPPSLILVSSYLSKDATTSMTVSSCLDIDSLIVTESNIEPSPNSLDWIDCSEEPGGVIYSLKGTSQGTRSLYIWARDAASNISSSIRIERVFDYTPPVVSQVVVNPSGPLDIFGDTYAGTSNLTIRVKASDNLSNLVLRIIDVSVLNTCESQYVEGPWINYSENIYLTIPPLDGIKKICVWAKDEAGNKSVINGLTPETQNVNMDTITYEVGNIPQIVSLSVVNKLNGSTDFIKDNIAVISYSIYDNEGLDASPISISYTIDNKTWLDVQSGNDISVPSNVTWHGSLNSIEKEYVGTYEFPAPTNSFFKFKIVAKDRAGNTSVSIYSDVMNGTPWSIFAGNSDIGNEGTALAARVKTRRGSFGHFAISPKTNDLYMIDWVENISYVRKLDSRSGIVSNFITNGPTNLIHGGSLPDSISILTPQILRFDNNGILFIGTPTVLWAVNLTEKKSYKYLEAPNWSFAGAFTFDEANNLYYFKKCQDNALSLKLMKVSQNDGQANSTTHVAGNCTTGVPVGNGPFNPKEIPLGFVSNPTLVHELSSISAWDNGKYIYYNYYQSGGVFKILDGQWYRSNLPASTPATFFYNRFNKKLYGIDKTIVEYLPNLLGPNNDTVGSKVYISDTKPGDCNKDDILRENACVTSGLGADVTSSGVFLFSDGALINAAGTFRIRYIDPVTDYIKTLVGSLPFYGDNLSKELIRGDIGGITYKGTSTPGFPAGLYFTDFSAMTMGRIDPSTNKVHVMFGDQSMRSFTTPNQGEVNKTSSLGTPYIGGNGKPIMFDENQNLWFRAGSKLYKINYVQEDKKYILNNIMTGSIYWADAPDNADPKDYYLHIFGASANLTGTSKGIFVIGVANNVIPSPINRKPSIRYFDFYNSKVRKIMGHPTSETPLSAPNSVALDENIKDLPIDCAYGNNCFNHYESSTDTLYFREATGNRLRYITNVLDVNPTVPKLRSIELTRNPTNFTFRPNHAGMIYYLGGNGKLYCKDIIKSRCTDVNDLGPSEFIGKLQAGANQFTWIDSDTVLISGYNGIIYKLLLPKIIEEDE